MKKAVSAGQVLIRILLVENPDNLQDLPQAIDILVFKLPIDLGNETLPSFVPRGGRQRRAEFKKIQKIHLKGVRYPI